MKWFLIFLSTFSPTLGWASSAANKTEQAPVASKSTGPELIAFRGVSIRIPSDTKLGTHYDGKHKISQFSYFLQSNLKIDPSEFNLAARWKLRTYGYKILQGDEISANDEQSSKTRFYLAGTIKKIVYNTYGKFAGDFTEASLTVHWGLYDASLKEVVFEVDNTGYEKRSDVSEKALLVAFSKTLDNLLANKGFKKFVAKDKSSYIGDSIFYENPVSIKTCDEEAAIFLPNDIDKVLDGVVTIRAGSAIGSGVVISSDGFILTAAHVVSEVPEITVRLKSGLLLTAEIVRTDPSQDIALIKIPGLGHKCVMLELDSSAEIGIEVYAIGTPTIGEIALSLPLSVTKGVVSGHRLRNEFRYIQTDASLSPGNSGGPLVNQKGRVVGIVSWKIVAPGFEGLSFGVPLPAIGKRLGIVWK